MRENAFSRIENQHLSLISFFLFTSISLLWTSVDTALLFASLCLLFTGKRLLIAAVSIQLFMLSYTPFSMNLIFLSIAGLIPLWRRATNISQSTRSVILQSAMVGFLKCWSITGFIPPAIGEYGFLIQASVCWVFCLQYICIGVAVHGTRRLRLTVAIVFCVMAASFSELLERTIGVSWSVSNLTLSLVESPFAQWARVTGAFGLSCLTWLLGFGLSRFVTNLISGRIKVFDPGVIAIAFFWFGGIFITPSRVESLDISAVLIQPHIHHLSGDEWAPWRNLENITMRALQDKHIVDLIIWPETMLPESSGLNVKSQPDGMVNRASVRDFASQSYGTNLIAGGVIHEFAEGEGGSPCRFNCACLFDRFGEISIHRKLSLVPLRESLMGLEKLPFAKDVVKGCFGIESFFDSGTSFKAFLIPRRDGSYVKLIPVVCYESWHPWLPQYFGSNATRVYLLYDGYFFSRPELVSRQVQSIQMRCIETRSWGLVCSTWIGTCVVNPQGRVVLKAPDRECYIFTHEMVKVNDE